MAKGPNPRGGRGRFKTGRDVQDQFEDVDRAQHDRRKGKDNTSIDTIDKSGKRFDNELGKVRNADDAFEQFG